MYICSASPLAPRLTRRARDDGDLLAVTWSLGTLPGFLGPLPAELPASSLLAGPSWSLLPLYPRPSLEDPPEVGTAARPGASRASFREVHSPRGSYTPLLRSAVHPTTNEILMDVPSFAKLSIISAGLVAMTSDDAALAAAALAALTTLVA